MPRTISGYITEPDSITPVEGVVVDANNNGGDIDTTDINGYYQLTVDYGWSGTATPAKAGYTFEPNVITYSNVTADLVDDYNAILSTYVISGYALESDDVTPIEGVLMTPDSNGGAYTTKYYGGGYDTTDAGGYYEVLVDYNWSGDVVPSKYAHAFEPNSISYSNVTAGQIDQDYTGTLLTYIISGYIVNSCDLPLEGAVITATSGGGTDTSDASGYYEVWVDYNWSGTITPSMPYHTFEPNEVAYTDVLEDQSGEHYRGTNIYDVYCDGVIDWLDIMIISENWLDDLGGNLCDFNNDTFVDFRDFAEFAPLW